MTLALISLGNTYNKEGDYKTAIENYKKAEVLARDIGVNYQLEATFKALALSYATISDFEQAYLYQKLFSEIKDTLYNAENDKKIQPKTARQEIEHLCDKHHGLLRPRDIVVFAKNAKTALTFNS